MLIQMYQLKNYPSANLNRDDNNMPKSAMFGAFLRSRISSQCIKRNMRIDPSFIEALASDVGMRTRHLPAIVADGLEAEGAEKKYIEAAKAIVKAGVEGKSAGKSKAEADDADVEASSSDAEKQVVTQIMYFSKCDIEATCKAALDAYHASSSLAEFKKNFVMPTMQPITPDIALFGRMAVADKVYLDVDSAIQVAHAFSTHKVINETDYFTAVDDFATNGAGHVNNADFNSCCYYEYANIDTDILKANLEKCDAVNENLMRDMILGTIKAFAFTNPTGKQNSFAAHVRPSAFMVEISDCRLPLNYANAYLTPAKPSYDKDLVAASIEKLCGEVETMDHDFGKTCKHRLWFCTSNYAGNEYSEMKNATKCDSFTNLMDTIENILKEEM